MTNQDFILNIIKLYQKSRETSFYNKKIKRGRSRSISSSAEDLFALYLADKIDCDFIFVDQPISVIGHKSQFYPDIVVIKNNNIISFCDLKLDLGWKRGELTYFCKDLKIFLSKIRNKECKIRDGVTKEDRMFKIHPKVSFNIVVVSDQNIPVSILKEHEKNIKLLAKDVELFILSRKEHPNTYGYTPNKLIKKIEVKDEVFDKLINKIGRKN